MGLDTKYRPLTYRDLLGQISTIKILKQFVSTGIGFQQSYLFAGSHGCGKTSMGRILARALLCHNPQEGEPCDTCDSCVSILQGTSENFIEFDAATNSGKADIKKITDELQFSTFSGKRRLYLMDESHRLSKDALDALLKPLEDEIDGTGEKKLICIFCTTEPEKMRPTILSRCSPTFVVETLKPDQIAEHLAMICGKEGISFEPDALKIIAEMTECHVRDAIKAVEGVSMLGSVNRSNVQSYLHLDLNDTYVDILLSMVEEPQKAIDLVDGISTRVAPTTAYEKLSEICLLAYRLHLGVGGNPHSFWDLVKLKKLGEVHGTNLVRFASRLSSRPSRVTFPMLVCDLATIEDQPFTPDMSGVRRNGTTRINETTIRGSIQTADGCHIDTRAVRNSAPVNVDAAPIFTPAEFSRRLELGMAEKDVKKSGHTGRSNMGDPGTDKIGGNES